MSIKEWFKTWDSDQFDLTAETAGDMHPVKQKPGRSAASLKRPIKLIENHEIAVFRRIYPFMALILGLALSAFLMIAALDMPSFGEEHVPANNEVIERYIREGMQETGAVNTVAGIILDYRAFDTLGESHVLFTALTAVLILLMQDGTPEKENTFSPSDGLQQDRIVTITATVLVPFILLFGIYIILNGHLGPGGGFAGGAIIGAGLILYVLAFGYARMERVIRLRTFLWILVFSLCFYSISKCYSFLCGANGWQVFYSVGTPGSILSAGLILPLNIAVGIVVATTMYGLYSLFQRGRI